MTSIKSDRLEYLVYGYINDMGNMLICNDIIYMIHMYCSITWILPEYSMKCIAATHLVASRIYQYLNDERNRCEFNHELSKDVLKYIYVRGGAPRDCCLLRKIKDIDVVVDINTLNKKYLHHLKTYHSNFDHVNKTNCIFYRHYLNQFDWHLRGTEIHWRLDIYSVGKFDAFNKPSVFNLNSVDSFLMEPTANKIYNYGARISNCDWAINSRFYFNILLESDLCNAITIECRKTNWALILNNYTYQNMNLQNISFDFVDSSGQPYGQLQTLKQLQSSFGLFDVDNVIAEIDNYYRYCAEMNAAGHNGSHISNISVPIHPTEMNMLFYDFTINALHISFESVLSNNTINTCHDHFIDFNWEKKVRKSDHENIIINQANAMGLKDINAKILKAPYINVINECTANFYFWRLVKTAQKWITEIENDIWKIDPIYLQHTINHYRRNTINYFNSRLNKYRRNSINVNKFVNKFLYWNIEHEQDIIDRLHVFRYIGFENHFKKLIIAQPDLMQKIKMATICVPTVNTETKIISAPFFKLINKCTVIYYFLKFVETIQKYMTQIKNKIWKIEEKYLNCIIDSYPLWVRKMTRHTAYWFVDKLNMITEQDLIDKISVFQYIQFAKMFRKLIKSRPELIEKISIICCPYVDTNAQIIKAPHFKVIRVRNAKSVWYFLKFVETVQKYINEIENKTWKIDDIYLQYIINSYPLWLNDRFCFVNKLLCNDRKWNEKYFIDRLKVFRHIKFEKHLQKVLIEYPKFFEMNNIRKYLYVFGYKIPLSIGRNPSKRRSISNVIELYEYIPIQMLSRNRLYNWNSKNKATYKNCKMYKHCKFIYDDYILKNNYFFNENNLKLSEKIKKKWSNQKRMNRLKYKRRNDRKQNAKSITKFKRRYALCLQY
eukprot:517358_1